MHEVINMIVDLNHLHLIRHHLVKISGKNKTKQHNYIQFIDCVCANICIIKIIHFYCGKSSDDGIAQHFKQQLNISNDRRRSNYRQASNEMPHGHENVDHRSNQCRHSLGRTTPSEFRLEN